MAQPVEWLNEFQVNTGTADVAGISDPQVVGLAGGNYLVAWTEAGTGGVGTTAGNDIIGKIFDAEGNLVRDSFRLNTNFNADDEDDFDIAATNDGGFILVYVDDDLSNSSQEAIRWEKHNAAGDMTNTVTIASNTVAADILANPKVVVNNNDNTSYVTFTDLVAGDSDIRAVRVDDDGSVLTAEFNAAQNSTDRDGDAETAININGELVVVYEEFDSGTGDSIELRVYSTAGVLQHQVTVDAGPGSDPQVATLVNGNIVVSWTEGTDIKYRVFDQNLVPDAIGGGPFNVDTSTDTYNESSIAALPNGDFIITWDNDTANTLQARTFNSNGSVGAGDAVFQIEPTAGTEVNPNVAALADGRIVFSWEEGDNVISSIWDGRGTAIDADDYDGLPLNFVETDLTTTNILGTTLTGDSDSDTILGQAGNDSITGGSAQDSIDGGAGNDTIEGGFSTDTVNGGAGNDIIFIRDGEFIDDVDGGTGNDTLSLSNVAGVSEAVNVDLRNGTWTGLGGTQTVTGIETVFATLEDDTLRGNGGSTLFGSQGDDIFDFRSGDGFPDFNGGLGTDTADFSSFTSTNFFINLATGGYRFNATTAGAFSGDIISTENYIGGDGIDNVLGSALANDIGTRGGNDTVNAGNGDDTVTTGNGNDLVNGGFGNDSILGQGGNDLLRGDSGNDTMIGGAGLDTMEGGTGNDNLFGQGSNDRIFGGAGNDFISGGSGSDFIDGGDDNDFIQGQGNNDTINGGNGNDTILGQAGLDQIFGGAGNDSLKGDGASDTISGSFGDDTIDGGTERDSLDGGSGDDLMFGGGGKDTMDGGANNDTMDGGTDTDIVNGGNGNDNISGGGGNDTLDGGAGGDTVDGGIGSDLILVAAGEGGDVLFGGTASDIFDFEAGFVSAKIEDFGTTDFVDLQDAVANSFGALGITYSGGGTSATVDVGGGDEIIFNNLTAFLNAGDFIF